MDQLKVSRFWHIRRQLAVSLLMYCCVIALMPAGFGQTDRVSQLIGQLKNPNPDLEKKAADDLVKIGAPAVLPLIAALIDADHRISQNAARVLGEIKDPRAVGPLIAALKGTDADVWDAAAKALREMVKSLREIKDPIAIDPLIAALKDSNPGVRKGVAYALVLGSIKDPRTISVFQSAWKERDFAVIAGARTFFIIKEPGEPGFENVLIESLDKFGDGEMAQELLNGGNTKLKDAARTWAASHGYQVHAEVH